MKLLTAEQVTELTGLSRTSVWRLERAGEFPSRVRLSPNRVAWRADELQEWVEGLPRGTADPKAAAQASTSTETPVEDM